MASVADQLANERTFLAYVRTALAFIGFGFVIARFSVYMRELAALQHHPLSAGNTSVLFGVIMVIMGIAVACFGAFRYASQLRALSAARPDALSVASVTVVVAVIAVFGLVMAYVLFHV